MAPTVCSQAGQTANDAVEIAIEGGGAHPVPVITAFQLGALHDAKKDSDTDPVEALTDIRAVGVATDLATAATFDDARLFFGVAVQGAWTTPARGPVSVVSIEINRDQIGNAERSIRVEARNPDAPFRDALVASTYDNATGERIARSPINIVTPDVAPTLPFHNSVLVLSAKLSELGITESLPSFGWAAVTESPDQLIQDERVKGVFDVTKPLVDTTRYGEAGAPLFVGTGSVFIRIPEEARAAGTPIDVLLFHHTNVPGQRWEVVRVPTTKPGNLALSVAAPASIERSATTAVTLVVTCSGADPAPSARLQGSVLGAEIVAFEPAQGACAAGAMLDCALGDIPAGGSVAVVATVRPTGASPSISIKAHLSSELACEDSMDDNDAAATMSVLAEPAAPGPKLADLYAGGGCACQTGAGEGANAGWLAAALGLLAARRRRGRAR